MNTEPVIKYAKTAGFTIVEMVVVLVIIAALFRVISMFLSSPIRAYTDVANRAELVEAADAAMQRMRRDIRLSVPNSVRIKTDGNYTALEIMNVVEGIRYRNANDPLDPVIHNFLDVSEPDTQFNVIGKFDRAQYSNTNYRLIVYNAGSYGSSTDVPIAGMNVYSLAGAVGPIPPAGSRVITPPSTIVTLSSASSTEDHITLSAPMQFAFPSPAQRLYVSDGPVSFICKAAAEGAGSLKRYSGYTIQEVQPADPLQSPLSTATSSILAQHITSCSFNYQPGTPQRNGIATISLTLTNKNESIQLVHQISVSNAP